MRITWIGLGNMGEPMAARLAAAGHDVTGFDLDEQARERASALGVTPADSAAAAAADAELVITMLPNGGLVQKVLSEGGVLDAAAPDAIFLDSSTTDTEDALALYRLVTESGRVFFDAPVSGGVGGAQKGTLTFMVGGTEEQLAPVQDVLDVMAGKIFYLGEPSLGQAAKIVNNLMLGVSLAGLAEGAALADRLGLDHSTFYELAKVSSGDSWALRNWYPIAGVVDTAAVNRDFVGGFAVDLLSKDLGLALAAGETTSTPLPHVQAVRDTLENLSRAGLGARDCAIIVRTLDGSIDLEGESN